MKKQNFQKNKIKLIHAVFSLDTGGLEKLLVEMLKRLDRDFFDVSVYCLTEEGAVSKEIERLGLKIRYFNKQDGICYKLPFKIARFLKAEKADLIHTHDSSANFYGGIAARLAGVNVILNTEHGGIYFESNRKKAINRFLTALNTKQICVSESIKKDLESMKVSNRRLITINNGIDLKIFEPAVDKLYKRKSMGVRENDFVITNVGRFSREKNQRLLLDAAQDILEVIPNAKIVFVGDGELKEQLEDKAKAKGLAGRVFFLGTRNDVPEILKASDCFVNCSVSESFGLAIVEAMAAGMPVIATDVGGVKEIITNNETGILIKADDKEALIKAVLRIRDDVAYRTEIIKNAKERANKRYNIDNMVQEYSNLYKEVLRVA